MPVIQFKGKTAIESHHHTIPHHTLEFDPKLSVLTKGEKPSLDGNLIIEGENLLALKALLPTHAERIKCVYIDPAYNTGNEGWVYNDNLRCRVRELDWKNCLQKGRGSYSQSTLALGLSNYVSAIESSSRALNQLAAADHPCSHHDEHFEIFRSRGLN